MIPNDGINQLDTPDRVQVIWGVTIDFVLLDYAFHFKVELIFEACAKELCISNSFDENMVHVRKFFCQVYLQEHIDLKT